MTVCYEAIGRAGGRYACLEYVPPDWQKRRAIVPTFVLGYEMFGRRVALTGPYERKANNKLRDAAARWFVTMQNLWERGEIKSHPVQVLEAGWSGVLGGLDVLKNGGVSGKKLVVRVD